MVNIPTHRGTSRDGRNIHSILTYMSPLTLTTNGTYYEWQTLSITIINTSNLLPTHYPALVVVAALSTKSYHEWKIMND